MDADLKRQIESWLHGKLLFAGINIGCVQPTVTWDCLDTDIFELQQKLGNCFTFSVSGVVLEAEIIAAYNQDTSRAKD